jgi:hypothetical protein
MSAGELVRDHFTKLKELIDKLISVGVKINNRHLTTVVLNSLPKSFELVITCMSLSSEIKKLPSDNAYYEPEYCKLRNYLITD